MENPEVPLDEVQEHINEHAHGHAHGTEHSAAHKAKSWTMGVALSTALFAALAAVASLLAGQKANEAMSAQLESFDRWNYYQSKSIKDMLLETKDSLLVTLGHEVDAGDASKQKKYQEEKATIQEEAQSLTKEADALLKQHETFALSVTMFQVAIALAAISVLTGLRSFWFVSLGLGLIGVAFFLQGLFPGVLHRDRESDPHSATTTAPEKPDAHPGPAAAPAP